MIARKITVFDVCTITGYERDHLQAVLKELPPYNNYAVKPRVAREFTPHDVIALCVVNQLEIRFGVRRKMIGKISELLRHQLSGPKIASSYARLCISFNPPSVIYETGSTIQNDGIYISLKEIFERVDQYFSGGSFYKAIQQELNLPPVAVPTVSRRPA